MSLGPTGAWWRSPIYPPKTHVRIYQLNSQSPAFRSLMPAPDNHGWAGFAAYEINDRNALINLEILRQHPQAAVGPDDTSFCYSAMGLASGIPFHRNGDARIEAHAAAFLRAG